MAGEPATLTLETRFAPLTHILRRRLLPVAWGALSFDETVGSFTRLMGKGEAASRRELMELVRTRKDWAMEKIRKTIQENDDGRSTED